MGYRHTTDHARRSLIRGTNLLIDDFPKGIWRAACECTEQLLGIPIADTWLKTLEARTGIARSARHLAALRQLTFSSQTSTPPTTSGAREDNRDFGVLLDLFDETFGLLKLNIEKLANEMGIRLVEKFDRELTYITLYLFTTLLFRGTSSEDPTKISDGLTRTSLARLARFEDVQVSALVHEYRARFDEYRKFRLFTNADRVPMDEGALSIARHLTGSAEMLFGTLVTSFVVATLGPLRDGFASLGH
jgi:hypothetical protein